MRGAVLYRWRAELRARWRSWLALALLLALMGGAVQALVAGARRTDSAFSRLAAAEGAPHVQFGTFGGMLDPEMLGSAPVVEEWWTFHRYIVPPSLGEENSLHVLAPTDERAVAASHRWKLVEGRRADERNPDEAVVSSTVAEIYGVGPGDRLRLEFLDPVDVAAFHEGGPMAPPALVREPVVTGVVAPAGELPPRAVGRGAGLVLLTTAARDEIGPALVDDDWFEARFEGGFPSVVAFGEHVLPRVPEEVRLRSPSEIPTTMPAWRATTEALRVPAVGLWVLGGLTALTAVLIAGQLVSRAVRAEASEHARLSAVGFGRRELVVLSLGRMATVAVLAAAGGAVLGVAASPLFPIGLGRLVDPATGLFVDATVLVVGGLATTATILALAAVPSWRAAGSVRVSVPGAGSGRLPSAVRRAALSPQAAVGVYFGLHGGGARGVPLRSSVASIAVGVAALAVAVTFGASLSHLLDSPALYGRTWDVEVGDGWGRDASENLVASLDGNASVAAVAQGTLVQADVGDRSNVLILALEDAFGQLELAVAEGRAPAGPGEILLGSRLQRELGVDVGDEVAVSAIQVSWNPIPGAPAPRSFTVVGHGPTPEFMESRIGEGAVMTLGALSAALPEPPAVNLFLLRWADVPEEERVFPDFGWLGEWAAVPARAPSDIVNFGRVESFPSVAAGLMASIGLVVLAHVLVTSVRHRRRDLAVLKTLGFTRRQLAATVSWQASTIAVTAVLLGLPLGVVAGRWGWMLFADRAGVIPVAVVPIGAVAVVIAAALVAGNAVAALPAGAAVRTRPAAVLRTE